MWFSLGGVLFLVALLFLPILFGKGELSARIAGFIGVAVICILAGILIWFVLSHLVRILTALFICVGLLLIVSGMMDMLSVSTAREATVFQQIYALIEFVGGALVFCAAMILHVLRARLNPDVGNSIKEKRNAP